MDQRPEKTFGPLDHSFISLIAGGRWERLQVNDGQTRIGVVQIITTDLVTSALFI